MGRFLNPGNEAFSEVIHSEIYVDKTPLLEYTNRVISTTSKIYLQQPSEAFRKVNHSGDAVGILQQRQ